MGHSLNLPQSFTLKPFLQSEALSSNIFYCNFQNNHDEICHTARWILIEHFGHVSGSLLFRALPSIQCKHCIPCWKGAWWSRKELNSLTNHKVPQIHAHCKKGNLFSRTLRRCLTDKSPSCRTMAEILNVIPRKIVNIIFLLSWEIALKVGWFCKTTMDS